MEKQLKEFIEKSRKAGQSDLKIMESLTAAGWAEEIVLNSLRPDPTDKKKLPKKYVFLLSGIIVTVLAVLAAVIILKPSDNRIRSATTKPQDPKKNSAQPQKDAVVPDNENEDDENNDTVGKFIVYEKQSNDKERHRQIMFYNYETGKNIPEYTELKESDYWMINVGQWSPDGRFIPIFKYIPDMYYKNVPSDTSRILYLFDSKTSELKKLLELPIDYRKRQENPFIKELRTDPTSNVMRWLDEDKIVVRSYMESETEYYLNYITLKGEVKYEKSDKPFWQENSIGNETLYYEIVSNELDAESATQGAYISYKNIYFKGHKMNLSLAERPIGVIDDTMITLHVPMINPYLITERQQAEIKTKYEAGATEIEVLREYAKYYIPDQETFINYINPASGQVITKLELNEGGWHTVNAIFNNARKNFILYQTDFILAPGKFRILSYNPVDGDKKILSEGILDKNGKTLYAFSALSESFAITANGSNLIAYIYLNESLRLVNINLDTLDLAEICSSGCYSVKIPNPRRLRSYFDKI